MDDSRDVHDDPERALREVHARFVSGFATRHDTLTRLAAALAGGAGRDELASGLDVAHRLAGLAGTLGFPEVSRRAKAVEVELRRLADDDSSETGKGLAGLVAALGDAFAAEVSGAVPRVSTTAPARAAAQVLVVEDDADQRAVLTAILRGAGHQATELDAGSEVRAAVEARRPDLILLDIDLPGMDGLEVCRQLKTAPASAAIPIIFISARADLPFRAAGLALGADDYLTKPFQPAEVLLRLERVLARGPAAPTEPSVGVVSFEACAAAAANLLGRGSMTLALVRTAPGFAEPLGTTLVDDFRRRDVVASYGDSHMVVLLPELSVAAARERFAALVERFKTRGLPPVTVGLAGAPAGADVAFEQLLDRADRALAVARIAGQTVGDEAGDGAGAGVTRSLTVLIADDDPDVLHIVEPRLKAAGFTTCVALDGQQVLGALSQHAPDLVVLDLTMPKVTGFEVLARLRESEGPHPRTLVLSAHGREEDVTRAFELGADDYMTKPFSPEELVARVTRLLR